MRSQGLQIAAQLYTVREFTKNEEDIRVTLRKIKESGYDCVQISALGECRTEWLRDELGKNGLTVCATHTPYGRIVNDTDNVIREHKTIGCKYVGIGHFPLKSQDDVKKFLSDTIPVAKKLKDNGLKFVYHNHQHEFMRIDGGKRIMDYMLSNTDKDEFGLIADLYWLQYAGADTIKFIRDNAERIDVVHLKDMCIAEDFSQHYAEVFEGNMNYQGIFDALQGSGICYAAVEQDDCYGKDPFECLRLSRDNIRKYRGI